NSFEFNQRYPNLYSADEMSLSHYVKIFPLSIHPIDEVAYSATENEIIAVCSYKVATRQRINEHVPRNSYRILVSDSLRTLLDVLKYPHHYLQFQDYADHLVAEFRRLQREITDDLITPRRLMFFPIYLWTIVKAIFEIPSQKYDLRETLYTIIQVYESHFQKNRHLMNNWFVV